MAEAALQTDKRSRERADFLGSTPFAAAVPTPLTADASTRQYYRLEGGPSPALLMDAADAAKEPPCPPEADERQRLRLGYGACVRGSANSLVAYRETATILGERGIQVPSVLACDLERGFAIVSELEGRLLTEAAADQQAEEKLYLAAADVLDVLRSKPAADFTGTWPVQAYDRLAYETEAGLLDRWYLPKELGRVLCEQDTAELLAAWREVLGQLSTPRHFVHRDFHAENLLLTEEGVGVLDFQDMMVGQAAYDWVSLIEDARRDVGERAAELVYERGVSGAEDARGFETDYAVLGAQRNAKILGLFARLIHEVGKKRYAAMMSRVRHHFAQDLAREPLRPVREVLERVAPELLQP
ncbi:aminoglycoside phosphotransferase family protein [Parvularcula maris]|uniref:Phosphotransferase n=1 Tax=Parvularcula maris TaxID=2965077 RepID=A0A9X2RI94_9PROT|nr:phosphotransferase [Parvularcula maris]MCQ8184711.1 phosphotransferase [Parvularcula maris]